MPSARFATRYATQTKTNAGVRSRSPTRSLNVRSEKRRAGERIGSFRVTWYQATRSAVAGAADRCSRAKVVYPYGISPLSMKRTSTTYWMGDPSCDDRRRAPDRVRVVAAHHHREP